MGRHGGRKLPPPVPYIQVITITDFFHEQSTEDTSISVDLPTIGAASLKLRKLDA